MVGSLAAYVRPTAAYRRAKYTDPPRGPSGHLQLRDLLTQHSLRDLPAASQCNLQIGPLNCGIPDFRRQSQSP